MGCEHEVRGGEGGGQGGVDLEKLHGLAASLEPKANFKGIGGAATGADWGHGPSRRIHRYLHVNVHKCVYVYLHMFLF